MADLDNVLREADLPLGLHSQPESAANPPTRLTTADCDITVATSRPAMRIAVHDYAGHPFQFELSRALAQRGHEVRHFFFANDPGPKGVTTTCESDPVGFSIAPVEIKLGYSKSNFLVRFLGDRLYGREAARQIARFKPDLLISGNTPLDAQWALKRAANRSGARFVFWVQDFYSLAIERALSGRWGGLGDVIAKWYRRREAVLLGNSDSIVLISPDFRRYLPPSVDGSNAVHVVRNWGALDLISPRSRENAWRTRMGLDGKRVVMYTGTLGLKHDHKLLLALSDAFAEDAEVAIVVVAAGVSAELLKAANQARPRKNLILQPLQPAVELPDVLATADVLMAFLESDAAEFSVPSKLLSYLCAGRPIVLSAPPQNLSVAVLAESGGGLAVSPGDAKTFVTAVRSLLYDDKRRTAYGLAGRSYAEEHFQISNIALRFEEIFNGPRR
jgi:colanic acid biosynthesis glycosyl transferase WcaI